MSAPEYSGRLPALGAALLAALAIPTVAGAIEVQRYDMQGAAAICQPATSVYAASLRARPLGLVNEGTTDAFVSCALAGDPRAGGRGAMKVLAEVGATNTPFGSVTCTFVDGYQEGGTTNAIYRTKSAAVGGGTRGATLTWEPVEIAGAPEHIFRPAVQCRLSPGTALHYLSVTYDEDIGG
jgi:hypothetical protein